MIPPWSLLRLRRAFRRGDLRTVVAEGDRVAEELADAGTEDERTELALMRGVAHLGLEQLALARNHLELGITRADTTTTSPGPSSAPVVVPTPFSDWCRVALVELYLRTGAGGTIDAHLRILQEPHRPVTVRFDATRIQGIAQALAGHHERAHALFNTALVLASRVPSRFRAALVEADRAALLARQGRRHEALAIADQVAPRLIRPAVGPYQAWSRSAGSILAMNLARAAALDGDELTAHRLLLQADAAVAPLATGFLRGELDLTAAVVLGARGDLDAAETAVLSAAQVLGQFGYQPAYARALLEQGRLAHRRGLVRSARPMYLRAAHELSALGHATDAAEAHALLRALSDGRGPATVLIR